jgi:hypothetical protein
MYWENSCEVSYKAIKDAVLSLIFPDFPRRETFLFCLFNSLSSVDHSV